MFILISAGQWAGCCNLPIGSWQLFLLGFSHSVIGAAIGLGVFGAGSGFRVGGGGVHCGRGLIVIFRKFFASIKNFFIFPGRLGIRLSFYEF